MLLILFCITVGITLAFFSNSDFASKLLGTSGRVKIEAVGKGNKSIEDIIPNSCNLEIDYDRDYGVLIPNMPIKITANCKVYKSTTKPLIRASVLVTVIESSGNPVDPDLIEDSVASDFSVQLFAKINENNTWYYHSDGYWYLVDSIDGANSILTECDATDGDLVVPFLNNATIRVPSYIDDTYSGLGIKIKITFQAIQNYIPDGNGRKLPNTITNSLKIFNEFKTTIYESSPISWFNTIESEDGAVWLTAKEGVTYPSYLRLPEKSSDGKIIAGISSGFAQGNASIKNIYVPSNYTIMAEGAFRNSSIETIDLSDSSITVIPYRAFYNAKLLNGITLPKTLKAIESQAFYATVLTTLDIPEGCVRLESSIVVDSSSFEHLYIPSTLTDVKLSTFGYLPSLQTISVASGNPVLRLDSGSMLISSSGYLLACVKYGENVKNIQIPDDVISVYSYAFYNHSTRKDFENITIGRGLTSIDFTLPYNLKSLSIGNNTNFAEVSDSYGNKYILNSAKTEFMLVNVPNNVNTLSLPDTVQNINANVLPSSNNENIKHINFGKDFNMNGNAFDLSRYRGLESVSIDSNNTNHKTLTGCEILSYNGEIFYLYPRACKNTEYTIPSSVTTIYDNAMRNNGYLEKLTMLDSVTNIGSCFCIGYSNLKEVYISSNNTKQNAGHVFSGCSKLTSITWYGGLITNSLSGCSALKTVTISNCSRIGMDFCKECKKLEWVEFTDTTPPSFESQLMFQNAKSDFVIYVPDSALDAYKTANNLSVFASRIRPVSERG